MSESMSNSLHLSAALSRPRGGVRPSLRREPVRWLRWLAGRYLEYLGRQGVKRQSLLAPWPVLAWVWRMAMLSRPVTVVL